MKPITILSRSEKFRVVLYIFFYSIYTFFKNNNNLWSRFFVFFFCIGYSIRNKRGRNSSAHSKVCCQLVLWVMIISSIWMLFFFQSLFSCRFYLWSVIGVMISNQITFRFTIAITMISNNGHAYHKNYNEKRYKIVVSPTILSMTLLILLFNGNEYGNVKEGECKGK